MKKATMLTYLEEQLEKHLGDYEVGLDWDRKNHTIEVIVRLYAENNQKKNSLNLKMVCYFTIRKSLSLMTKSI